MNFDLKKGIEILERTPTVLESLLLGLSEDWIVGDEGEDTWSPYEVVGHLIVGEKTDWIPRTKIMLSDLEDKTFTPFDRFAQAEWDKDITLEELLKEFRTCREKNILELKEMELDDHKLNLKGIHPELGEVNVQEILSCWVTHDLSHLSQISRVMAKQLKDEVGAWRQYLAILKT